MSIIGARAQLDCIGVQHRQADLEDGPDAAVEEAVEDTQRAAEGQHTHEQRQEPRERRRGQRREVRDQDRQIRETLTNQLLKH